MEKEKKNGGRQKREGEREIKREGEMKEWREK